MSFPFQTVALIGKHKNPEIIAPLLRLALYLEARNLEVVVDCLTAENILEKKYATMTMEDIGRRADLAIVLGGDGTMLNFPAPVSPVSTVKPGTNSSSM